MDQSIGSKHANKGNYNNEILKIHMVETTFNYALHTFETTKKGFWSRWWLGHEKPYERTKRQMSAGFPSCSSPLLLSSGTPGLLGHLPAVSQCSANVMVFYCFSNWNAKIIEQYCPRSVENGISWKLDLIEQHGATATANTTTTSTTTATSRASTSSTSSTSIIVIVSIIVVSMEMMMTFPGFDCMSPLLVYQTLGLPSCIRNVFCYQLCKVRVNSVSYIEECNDLTSKALRAAMVKGPLNACDRNWVEGGVVEHGGTPTPGESARLGSTSQNRRFPANIGILFCIERPLRQNMTQHFNAHLNHVWNAKYLGIFRVLSQGYPYILPLNFLSDKITLLSAITIVMSM